MGKLRRGKKAPRKGYNDRPKKVAGRIMAGFLLFLALTPIVLGVAGCFYNGGLISVDGRWGMTDSVIRNNRTGEKYDIGFFTHFNGSVDGWGASPAYYVGAVTYIFDEDDMAHPRFRFEQDDMMYDITDDGENIILKRLGGSPFGRKTNLGQIPFPNGFYAVVTVPEQAIADVDLENVEPSEADKWIRHYAIIFMDHEPNGKDAQIKMWIQTDNGWQPAAFRNTVNGAETDVINGIAIRRCGIIGGYAAQKIIGDLEIHTPDLPDDMDYIASYSEDHILLTAVENPYYETDCISEQLYGPIIWF